MTTTLALPLILAGAADIALAINCWSDIAAASSAATFSAQSELSAIAATEDLNKERLHIARILQLRIDPDLSTNLKSVVILLLKHVAHKGTRVVPAYGKNGHTLGLLPLRGVS
jgi:hypothetical protein